MDSPYINSFLNLSTTVTFLADSPYINSFLNLSTTVTFLVDSPYINSCLNLSTVPKVAVVERFNSITAANQIHSSPDLQVFIGVVGSLLFCGVGIIKYLFNLL